MHLASHGIGMRPMGALMAVAVLCAVTMVSLSQCIMVPDRVTGLSRAKKRAGRCFAECADRYSDSLEVEKELHERNDDLCHEDPACEAIEDARHKAAKERIRLGRQQCQQECHHQGGGRGR